MMEVERIDGHAGFVTELFRGHGDDIPNGADSVPGHQP